MPNPIENLASKAVGIEKGAVATVKGLTGVFKTLCEQHGEASSLLSRAKASTDPEKRVELWTKIRMELLSHEKGELAEVYPELRQHAETRAFAEQHDQEAADLEAAIKAVDKTDASSASWLQKLDTLITLVTNHVAEEEQQIFPVAEKVLGREKTAALDERFLAKKEGVAQVLPRPSA
jgi:hemerythrin superfamily protein